MKPFEHGGNLYKMQRETGVNVKNWTDFSANLNPHGPSPLGMDAVLTAVDTVRFYPDPDYVALRKAISDYHLPSLGVLPENVYPTGGGIEAIYDVIRAVRPKKCLIVVPAFLEYERAACAVGAEIVHVILEKDKNFQLDETSFLEAIDKERPDLVVLGSPNNPTGGTVPKQLLEKALIKLRSWQGALLTDEAFMDFLTEEAAWSMLSELSKWPELYVARSLTKYFAVPGLRIGYVVSGSDKMKAYWRMSKPVWGVGTLAEAYVMGAFQDLAYIKMTRQSIPVLRQKLMDCLSGYPDIRIYSGDANYLLIEVEERWRATLEETLRASRIMIRKCSNYVGLTEGFYRLAVLDEAAIFRLGNALESVSQQMTADPAMGDSGHV